MTAQWKTKTKKEKNWKNWKKEDWNGGGHYFDHERLDVYRVALEFARLVPGILARVPRGRGHVKDNLLRASDSIVLNVSEGACRGGGARLNHYRIARGSAGECGSVSFSV